MPRFKYKAKLSDSETEKIGYLDAPSFAKAKAYLKKKGYEVSWLRDIRELKTTTKSSELVIKSSGKTVYGRDYDVGEYRRGLSDYWQDNALPRQVVHFLLGLSGILGLLVLFMTWGGSSRTESGPGQNGRARYEVQLAGRVLDNELLDSLELTVSFPEIPYQQTWKGRDVLDEDGRIKTEIEFMTTRHASHCNVEVSAPGREPIQRNRLALSGFESSLKLGALSFKTP